jgi:translation initiation factor 5B
MQVPGLLIIDTPGHESFNNLRYRGSSLCDIAILVIDINHGLEPQTRESLEMLKVRKCPFLIALNKIDRLYDWVATPWESAQKTLKKQKDCTQQEFSSRLSGILLQLAETGLNCDLWWNIKNVKKTVSVVPTSAMTAEGIPDLLYLLVNLTQSVMTRSLSLKDTFQCTILEVKAIEGRVLFTI